MSKLQAMVCAGWKRGVLVVAAGAMGAGGLGGCLNQSQYDRVNEAYKSCEARSKELERERDEARLSLDQLRNSYGRGEGTLAALQAENAQLRQQLEKAQQNYSGMEQRLSQLTFGPLDAQTNSDLSNFANRFGDLVAFDAQRGMLRIASDLTFDSGSAVVKPQAKQALGALAQLLNSGSASQYEVVVEGHTDSQRMSRPETLREHKSNRGLSAHRSIAVIDELTSAGVNPARLMAAGWGEFRPAVPNTATGNTPANRRVEIYLAKIAGGGAGSANVTPPSVPIHTNVPIDNIK